MGLFGGDQTTRIKTLSHQQEVIDTELRKFLMSKVDNRATQWDPTKWGPMTASLIPQYQNAMGMLSGFNPTAFLGSQMGLLNALGSQSPTTTKGFLDPKATAKYFQTAVTNPMLHLFDTQIEPRIRNAFGNVGAFSSALGTTTASALKDLSVDISRQLGQVQMDNQRLNATQTFQAAESAAQRGLQGNYLAYQGLGDLRNLPLSSALGYMQALSPFQQKEEQIVGDKKQEFLRTAIENSPWVSTALNYLGQQHTAIGLTGGNSLGAALGGGLSGAMGIPALGGALAAAAPTGSALGMLGGSLMGPLGIGLGALLGFGSSIFG